MRAINHDLARILKESAEEYKTKNTSKLAGFFHGKKGLYRATNIINGTNEALDPVVLLGALLNSTSNGLKDIVLNKLIIGSYAGLMSEKSFSVTQGSKLSSILFKDAYFHSIQRNLKFFDSSQNEYSDAWLVTFNKETAVRHFIALYRDSLNDEQKEVFDAQIKSDYLERKPAVTVDEGVAMKIR